MHEQSETIERYGKFFNVYGAATPKAGKVLPGEPAYNTLKEAVTAAKSRSEQYGHRHRDNMGAPGQADVRKVDNKMAAEDDKKAAQYRKEAAAMQSLTSTPAEQERMREEARGAKQDAKNVRGATSGFTTRDRMGEKFAKGGSIRGDGIAQRGKTKGRMV